jgi:hypothetical protein
VGSVYRVKNMSHGQIKSFTKAIIKETKITIRTLTLQLLQPPSFRKSKDKFVNAASITKALAKSQSIFKSLKVLIVVRGLVSVLGQFPNLHHHSVQEFKWWQRPQDNPPPFYWANFASMDFFSSRE